MTSGHYMAIALIISPILAIVAIELLFTAVELFEDYASRINNR